MSWDKVKVGQKVYYGSSPLNYCGKVVFNLWNKIIFIRRNDGKLILLKTEWFIMDLGKSIKQKQETIDQLKNTDIPSLKNIYYWNISEQARNKMYYDNH